MSIRIILLLRQCIFISFIFISNRKNEKIEIEFEISQTDLYKKLVSKAKDFLHSNKNSITNEQVCEVVSRTLIVSVVQESWNSEIRVG